jgi:tRNA nucleotidyltransferase (CCA-adding enzyme)
MATGSGAQPGTLLARLPGPIAALLARAALIAASQSFGLWLVGGVIRDLLLGQTVGRDLDLAVEGDALLFAAALAADGGQVVAAYAPFGTATVKLPGPAGAPLLVDLARTRVEHYPRPTALPEVRPASISDDLIRRDFSINALALELLADNDGLRAGRLLDPFGGQADLAAGLLRLLHADSLRDDPTRILRGVRLAARLDLRPEPATAAQLDAALEADYLGMLTAERVLGELCLALEERRPDAALRLADRWGVTPQILPWLAWSPALAARAERLAEGAGPAASTAVWAGNLLYDLPESELQALAAHYPLPAELQTLLHQLPLLPGLAVQLRAASADSQIDRLLRRLAPDAVAVLHYAEPAAATATARYLSVLHARRTPLDGHDLRRLGVSPGPQIGQLLDELRAATLDGVVTNKAQAEAWVVQRLTP